MVKEVFFIIFFITFLLALLIIINSIGYLMFSKLFFLIGRKARIIFFKKNLKADQIIQKLSAIKFLKHTISENTILVRCRIIDKYFYIKPRAIIHLNENKCLILYDDFIKFYILLFLLIIFYIPLLFIAIIDILILYIVYIIIALIIYFLIYSIFIYFFSKLRNSSIEKFITIFISLLDSKNNL